MNSIAILFYNSKRRSEKTIKVKEEVGDLVAIKRDFKES